jgi:hypothetical protein
MGTARPRPEVCGVKSDEISLFSEKQQLETKYQLLQDYSNSLGLIDFNLCRGVQD